jgi:putative RNA 2'-phosphotransferase
MFGTHSTNLDDTDQPSSPLNRSAKRQVLLEPAANPSSVTAMSRPEHHSGNTSMRLTRLSRLVALVLRHRPDEVGIELDAGGFAPLDELAAALATQPGWESVSPGDLHALAAADPRRYEIRDGRIRARYGHTVTLEQPGEPAVPPEWLFYGAGADEMLEIQRDGLRPTTRVRVHLSTSPLVASEIGRRHADDAAVIVIFARRAADAGVEFRQAGPALFLSPAVPAEFLLFP